MRCRIELIAAFSGYTSERKKKRPKANKTNVDEIWGEGADER